jgi:hypothetical protein
MKKGETRVVVKKMNQKCDLYAVVGIHMASSIATVAPR